MVVVRVEATVAKPQPRVVTCGHAEHTCGGDGFAFADRAEPVGLVADASVLARGQVDQVH